MLGRVRTRICNVNVPPDICRRVEATLRSIVPDADLRYAVDEDGLPGFDALVHLDADKQGLANLIWSMLRQQRPPPGPRR